MLFHLRVWPVLLLSILSACASQNLSSSEIASISRVAIVSAVGNEMSTVEFAMIPIDSEAIIDPIDVLDFDRFVEDAIAANLASRFEVVRLDPRPRVDHASKDAWWYADSKNTTIHWPQPPAADTYIAVIPGTGMLYGTHFQIHGVYMATHPHMFGDEERDIGTLYHLLVIDARTNKVIKSLPAHAARPISRENWASRFSALGPTQQDAARQLLEAGMAQSLGETLKKLGLAQ